MGRTGLIWKNDANRHGCGVTNEGLLSHKHRCKVCREEIEATDKVIYAYANRGTMMAISSYVHEGCLLTLRTQGGNGRNICRVCDKAPGDIYIPIRRGRGVWLHEACIPDINDDEVQPIEFVLKAVKKRSEDRLKRARMRYYMKVKHPYDGHTLLFDRDRPEKEEGHDLYRVEVRPFDGKLVRIQDNDVYWLMPFESGHWTKEEKLRKKIEDRNKDNAKWNRPVLSEEEIETLIQQQLALQTELKKDYNARGYPIEERLDADFEMRYLLKHGNTLEGMRDDIQEAQ